MTKTIKQIRTLSCALLLSTTFGIAIYPITTHAASQGELKGVKSEISRQQKALSSQQKKLDSLQANLKKQELSIASLEKGSRKVRNNLQLLTLTFSNSIIRFKRLLLRSKSILRSLSSLFKLTT